MLIKKNLRAISEVEFLPRFFPFFIFSSELLGSRGAVKTAPPKRLGSAESARVPGAIRVDRDNIRLTLFCTHIRHGQYNDYSLTLTLSSSYGPADY